MIGAIIGDIAGSRFELHNHKSKDFELMVEGKSCFTDDTVMTLAIAKAIMMAEAQTRDLGSCAVDAMQEFGREHLHRGYGGLFRQWLTAKSPKPYGSYGNGAPMRVSACGWKANSLDEAQAMAEQVTVVTHNHPEAVKAAKAVASAIYLSRAGKPKDEIRRYIVANYYPLDFTLDEIRPSYTFDVSSQGSTPQALQAFFESNGFEDAIRTAVSIGGDSDTIAAITGSIAEAYYGVPDDIRKSAESFLDSGLLDTLHAFERSLD